jgi:starch phosphorylase
MAEKKQKSSGTSAGKSSALLDSIQKHIVTLLGNDYRPPRKDTYYNGLAYYVRDELIRQWLDAQRSYYDAHSKRVYYLSLEFLPGRFLMNYIHNMRMKDECEKALEGLDFTLEDLEEEEYDAGLGNGGLGRLASCFMDSLATLKIPSYGYGIRYDYGIFYQKIVNGWQVEQCDNWIRFGNPWEFMRRGYLYTVNFYGRTESFTDNSGKLKFRWVDSQSVMAMACDIFIPGYANGNVINMRLWAALSSQDFDLEDFNRGDYIGAMEAKVLSENISKVLYPSDEVAQGRELRLKQQYFFVAATFQDIIRRFGKDHSDFHDLPNMVAVQLNDTHPAISIPELMRILLDDKDLGWEEAWDICVRTFAYTNHTVLPEALETWPVDIIGRILPRHLEIIYEINHRFLQEVQVKFPHRPEILSRLSIIQEEPDKRVRMAHLAIVGSHSVNGVAALHSRILKEDIFPEFDEIFPGKFINVTNGITQRRWLLQSNPPLAELISSSIGPKWITHLYELKKLEPLADDPAFRKAWRDVKRKNKERLSAYIKEKTGVDVDPASMFDIQVKRIHEYKRQLMNVLHLVTLYNRIKENPKGNHVPRTVIFAGKAAPAYHTAKLIIKLINSVAAVVNHDPEVNRVLRAVFLPNYCVSQAEKVMPAADLSEQISTAGMEASGTGNMKFSLNGALTIGTLDGANVEIMEEVGRENIFIFGLTIEEVKGLKARGYHPGEYYMKDAELRRVIDMIRAGFFSPEIPHLFEPVISALLDGGDRYLLLADYRSYVNTQEEAGKFYMDADAWSRKSILNTARMGKFSSDRAIAEYARNIWGIKLPDS